MGWRNSSRFYKGIFADKQNVAVVYSVTYTAVGRGGDKGDKFLLEDPENSSLMHFNDIKQSGNELCVESDRY